MLGFGGLGITCEQLCVVFFRDGDGDGGYNPGWIGGSITDVERSLTIESNSCCLGSMGEGICGLGVGSACGILVIAGW